MNHRQPPLLRYAIQWFDETGAMRAPYLLCKGFIEAGWQVEITTLLNARNAELERVWETVPVRKVAGKSKKHQLLALAFALLKPGAQTIVLSWMWDWHCFALLLAKLLFGNHYAIVLDTYSHRAFGTMREKVWQEVRYGLILRNATVILAEAPRCQEAILQTMKKPRVLLVPPGLWLRDLAEIEARWSAQGDSPTRQPTILYVGRVTESKNIHDLIAAFAQIAANFPRWRVTIVGPLQSPDYRQRLQKMAIESGLEARIDFEAGVSGDALYRKYRESSIVALPSSVEGFPTTIVEAMYFGGAIVASNVGYVAYQLQEGECGLLHTAGDVKGLAAHLTQLMADEDKRNQLISRAKQRMVDNFVWERHFATVEATFRELS